MSVRKGKVERTTKETAIKIVLVLEGDGTLQGRSGIGFLDHMLELLARHGGFSLQLEAQGDLHVDGHHTVEDIGLCLGQAFAEALGDKKGVARYSSLTLPMDEALVLCAVDISGRPGLYASLEFPTEKIGQFDCDLVLVFWQAFVNTARLTLHLRLLSGTNSHHIAEAVFKGVGRVLQAGARIEGTEIPSSKGVI